MNTRATNTALETGTAYIDAWNRKDVGAIRRLIHPDAHFKGPMSETSGRDALVAAVERMLPMVKSVEIRSSFANGNEAMFTYDFECAPPIGVSRVADHMVIEDGLIRDTEVIFDARPFERAARG